MQRMTITARLHMVMTRMDTMLMKHTAIMVTPNISTRRT